jgi:hypothetical protein
MSPYPVLSEPSEMIGQIFRLVREATDEEKYWTALTMMAGVLLKKDEFTRERMLARLPAELREAFDRLQTLYHELSNDGVALQ